MRVLATQADQIEVGRDGSSGVCLPHSSVSRKHAAFIARPSGYWLVDRGSLNGTKLNGRSIRAARVESGDSASFGDFRVWIQVLDEDPGLSELSNALQDDAPTLRKGPG